MSINDIRENVMKLYPNPTWAAKVSKMPNNQVFAIWKNKQESSKFLKEHKVVERKSEDGFGGYHQMNIWEWMNRREEP